MKFPFPKQVLMVRPNGFRVEYAINPYMRDENGNLQKIDEAKAYRQWQTVKETFTSLGLHVHVIEGDPAFPDMVFCANQTLPYWQKDGSMALILARMRSPQRQGEVRYFQEWADRRSIPTLSVTDHVFEGAGDAIWNYETRELLGGFGFRSDEKAYNLVEQAIGRPVHRLRLIDETFYHMDTCLAVLRGDTVAYVPEAFDEPSRNRLKTLFPRQIEIDFHEARHHFAGNCISVDGIHVMLNQGSSRFVMQLKDAGFTPIEVETTEFLKSGGSVFCIKQLLL